MGRQRQQKAPEAKPLKRQPSGPAPATRMARVQASDEVWADFRALAGRRSVSAVLGELVEAEVERHRSQRLRDGDLQPHELIAAVERAREQQADLALLVERLEILERAKARGATNNGHRGGQLR